MKEYIMSDEAMQICIDYGMKLMLTEREVKNLLKDMTEDEFCKGNFYGVLDKASGRLHKRWRQTDLCNEYRL